MFFLPPVSHMQLGLIMSILSVIMAVTVSALNSFKGGMKVVGRIPKSMTFIVKALHTTNRPHIANNQLQNGHTSDKFHFIIPILEVIFLPGKGVGRIWHMSVRVTGHLDQGIRGPTGEVGSNITPITESRAWVHPRMIVIKIPYLHLHTPHSIRLYQHSLPPLPMSPRLSGTPKDKNSSTMSFTISSHHHAWTSSRRKLTVGSADTPSTEELSIANKEKREKDAITMKGTVHSTAQHTREHNNKK